MKHIQKLINRKEYIIIKMDYIYDILFFLQLDPIINPPIINPPVIVNNINININMER